LEEGHDYDNKTSKYYRVSLVCQRLTPLVTIPTVDFTMGGPWLFEVQVQAGSETHKAYFAASIGEE
jgi:hypothetical protein